MTDVVFGSAIVVAASACVAFLPPPRLTRAAWGFLALLATYAAWVGLSLLWSWAPDRAWDAFNRDLVYLACAVIGLYLARLGLDRLGIALTVAVGLVCVWALLTRVVPSLDEESARVDRLREPIGYWNMLAFVLVLGLPLALRLRRDVGTVLVYSLTLALLLTYSRGGLAAGVVAVAAYMLLARPPILETAAVLAAGALPAAVVFASDADGAIFGLLLVAGAAVAFSVLRFVPTRVLAAAGAAVAAAGVIAAAVAIGNPFDEFRNDPSEQRPGDELVTATSNHRWTWWNEAWDAWTAAPAAGRGAGSFELVHRRLRENELEVTDPHSLPLAALSETGLIGLLLLGGAAAAAIAAARPALRGRETAPAALAAGGVAYLAHSLVDLHWQYAAATGPVLVAAGALAGAGLSNSLLQSRAAGGLAGTGLSNSLLQSRARPGPVVVAAAGVAAVGLVYSLAAPALADSRVAEARELTAARDFDAAIDAAESARSLNPVDVEPLFALGLAHDLAGDDARALGAYEDAIAQQPESWETWYELGVFEYLSLRNLDAALLDLDKAYALDRRNVIVQRVLDRVRAELNEGG